MASTGEDKKISLWRKNGQSLGTVPVTGKDGGDNAEVNFFLSSDSSFHVLHLLNDTFYYIFVS